MEFRVLGPVEIRAGGRLLDAGHSRQRAVLAVLVLELGRVVPAEALIDRVWDEEPPASVRNVLSGHVARLKAALAADPEVSLSRQAGGYLLAADPERVDVCRFRALVAAAAAAGDEQAAALLRGALGLWRGPALAGLRGRWLQGMREGLERERSGAVLALADVRLRLGEHDALATELAGPAAAAPGDERLAGQLMLALYRSGQQAAALDRFEHTRQHLAGELGADPGPQLQKLHAQILRADPALLLPAAAAGTRSPGSAAGPVPRQLPADVAAFTGRGTELAELDLLLPGPGAGDARPAAAVISAVAGTAGVGKTALALHWAHQAAANFPDGQLHVNLRGYDPSGSPATPEAAIRGFLDALGVPPERIPPDPQAQAGLYRSLLSGKRMLIVLDNAANEQQVRPLLPASPGSLVVVTSRRQLAGLAAADGARLVSLDVLSHAEAVQLLTARIGADRTAAEPAAVDQIAGLCACLPLALAVTAARAATRPRFPLAALADELAGSAGRLDALDAGDPATSVRTVFSWSTRQLAPDPARMFRLLGLHPGPDISIPAAASLAAISEPQARRLLAELARAHLITEHRPGRYAFHDLLRAYAASQARTFDSQDDRHAAIGRVLDHYLHTTARAEWLLNPATEPVDLAALRPGAAAGQLANSQQAMAWFEAEHQVLLAAVTLASDSGFDSHAWQLPSAMASFLHIRGHYQECAATAQTALAAATRLGDTAGQALSGRLLALACTKLGDHDQARSHNASSLTLYQQLGNRLGEAKIQQNLAWLAELQGRYADGIGHAEQALRLYQAIGDQGGEADALNSVGWLHCLHGDYQQARAYCRQAVILCTETGYRWLEGKVWDSLGYAEHHLGNFAEAAACYQRALSLKREVGARHGEATTLTHLGDTRHAADELDQAREAWRQALAVFEDLQLPDAGQVRAKLASANDPASQAPSG